MEIKMKKVIWKYVLEEVSQQVISLPKGAEILTVQVQRGELCLWARVDQNAAKVGQNIAIHGTGHDLPENIGEYIGTYQKHGGVLVFHVFKVD